MVPAGPRPAPLPAAARAAAASALVPRGPARLLRGWTAAVVATVLAAGSHTLAGGLGSAHDAGPHPVAWILTLALAAPLCTALAGRALSWWRLLGAVGASQLLFHAAYSLAAPSAAGHPAGPSPDGGHAVHAVHAVPAGHALALAPGPAGASALPADPAALGPDPAGAGMVAAHVLAAVVTVLLLRRGERLALRVVDLAAGLVLRAPGARLARWMPTVPVPRVPSRPLLPVPGPGIVVSSVLRWRGPPVLLPAR
ncbi:hypothetical protein E7744_02710 [Citricoccus sp. SGAir0253]|uniref:hypothetical protein n=1 Tax=Citricoccus sp. SGAir0253 TaxID=2567881 RepID=UPI0010CCBDFB|nr:hypothetical protein [Citricoccus sp. SGAir0253]QCU77248.1 hypothetical protein E7744_02710 [Citricoccus sp. SGAir0253]